MSFTRSSLCIFALASSGLVTTSCADDPDSASVGQNPTAHPTIRTFARWVDESGHQLTAEQQERLGRGEALLGLVPPDQLPVLHEQAGVIEMTPDMFDRGLDYRTNYEAWAAAGLYDPRSQDQRETAMSGVSFAAEMIDAGSGAPDAAVVDAAATPDAAVPPPPPPPPGWNCNYIVIMTAALTNDPNARTTTNDTRACTNYGGYSANHYIGGAPAMGAYANGGYFNGSTRWYDQCVELAQSTGAAQSLVVTRPALWGTEALDPNFPKRCPAVTDFGVQADISARAQSRLRGNLHVEFTKVYQQWNPIQAPLREPWRGVASGQVEAFVDDSWRKAIANGQLMIGSNCQSTFSGSFSATAGTGNNGVNVGPSAGVWYTCATESWGAADVPRDQPIDAQVQNSSKMLRMTLNPAPPAGQGQSFSAGYKSSDFRAEAWSAIPAESAPWTTGYDMNSRGRSDVTGGCMEFAYEACNIVVSAGPGIGCRMGTPATASYTTNSGVTCLSVATATATAN